MENKKETKQRNFKMTIRTKMLLGFLSIVVLLAAVSAYSVNQIQGMTSKSEKINNVLMPTVTLLGIMNGDISDVERYALNIIVEKNPQEIEKAKESLEKLLEKFNKEREQLKELAPQINKDNNEIRSVLTEFNNNFEEYIIKVPEFVEQGVQNNYDTASQLHGEAYPLWNTANDNITKLIELVNEEASLASNSALELAQQAFIAIITLTIAAVVIALVIAFLISIMISKPVKKISEAANQIANGDLTGEAITLRNRDELNDLAISFNIMTTNLRSMIEAVGTTSEQVAASSEELQASAEQNTKASEQISEIVEELATGTSGQVDIVSRSSQAMNEMATGSGQIAELAQSVSESAIDAANQSAEGNVIIQEAVEQMGSVQASITSLSKLMMGLGERSAEIGTITEVINGIARQTNLLALNAAIEAARAGEHGRGFAVVADEVRKLAEESSTSAQKITDLVHLMQQDTSQAVAAVKENSVETENGMEVVTKAGHAFEQILNAVNKVAGEIQEVSAGAEQMAASSDEVVKYMEQISSIAMGASEGAHNVSAATEEQLASMEEIAASSSSLSQMAEQLQEHVNKFKV
ncbi:methyl-accepting chemotaxis protein [Paenibacillus turicensis]|uniref:Methyl-accepting chemotaxis protein n=1 Tax=Paenibacillus turicensis TaxID=160487 RepID=A0ABS4FW21_9BACL|nr:methyl-accepting chemotaxis protein [Paenibacillus turicensis]MBP1906715.1 methyl-accepting chemotaxis protein [Paenibacillus turicensis]